MKLNVVFLGCTNGYGYAFSACNTKVEFMARGLTECGDTCYIHNGPGGKDSETEASYHGIAGVGTVADYPDRHGWYLSPFFNYRLLVSDLKRWFRPDCRNIVILEAPYLPFYYLEIAAAKSSGYKTVTISHEWLGTFRCKNRLRRWVLHRYSDVFGYHTDAILPISEYIIKRIKKFDKPYLKVPVLADFSKQPSAFEHEPFFLYCVSAEYLRVIEIVLNGFKKFVGQHQDFRMELVLTGNTAAINAVKDFIDSNGLTSTVFIKNKLPYDELKALYSRASGLVVALNPDFEQDKARFSQKIAEYLSTGTAMISNNVGEVKHYFKDKKNAILDKFSPHGFYRSFCWIAEHPEEAKQIGLAGYSLGKEKFDYKQCGKELHDFIASL